MLQPHLLPGVLWELEGTQYFGIPTIEWTGPGVASDYPSIPENGKRI